jgi:hypothetical protein
MALFAGGLVLMTASTASASSVDCTTLTNPVYISGGSAAKPHLLALAAVLGSSVSLIYSAPTACVGLEDIVASPAQTESSSASYLDPTTGAAVSCTGPLGTPYPAVYIDIGVSGAYPSSCVAPSISLGIGYADFQGPIEPFEISVPWASTQNSITADAAYVVFGWGGGTVNVTPWTVPADVWTRGDTSAVQLVVADAIQLAGAKWLTGPGSGGSAQVLSSESTMVTTLASATNYDATIGILGSGGLDPVKSSSGGIKPLTFQAPDQDCGYYADSDVNHFDKINVRQGRYDIWGPEHFVTAVNSSGVPQSHPMTSSNPVPSTATSVQTVIAYITHSQTTALPFPFAPKLTLPELQSVIQAESNAFFIPQCAMQVSRYGEDSAELSYQPAMGCGCFFESVVGKGTTLSSYCTTCSVSSDCKTAPYKTCNFGYCEAQ